MLLCVVLCCVAYSCAVVCWIVIVLLCVAHCCASLFCMVCWRCVASCSVALRCVADALGRLAIAALRWVVVALCCVVMCCVALPCVVGGFCCVVACCVLLRCVMAALSGASWLVLFALLCSGVALRWPVLGWVEMCLRCVALSCVVLRCVMLWRCGVVLRCNMCFVIALSCDAFVVVVLRYVALILGCVALRCVVSRCLVVAWHDSVVLCCAPFCGCNVSRSNCVVLRPAVLCYLSRRTSLFVKQIR